MEKSSKRGKIPQQDWPSIITRYEAGETLASIARTYDCSPPAISYIVSRTRARSAAGEPVGRSLPPATEPQLIKAPGPETPANGIPGSEASHGQTQGADARQTGVPPRDPRQAEPSFDAGRHGEEPLFPDARSPSPPTPSAHPATLPPVLSARMHDRELSSDDGNPVRHRGQAHGQTQPASRSGNGVGHLPNHPGASGHPGGLPENGENRRRLHLPLNGGSYAAEPSANAPGTPVVNSGANSRAVQRPPDWQPSPGSDRSGVEQTRPPGPSVPRPLPDPAALGPAHQNREREGGAFIDQALRERVEGDITVFLAAFDAALADDSPESRTRLREATDRLLRAGARTRIELERLEARAPLSAREKSGQAPLFRR
jgi:hypothetical protein